MHDNVLGSERKVAAEVKLLYSVTNTQDNAYESISATYSALYLH